MALRHIRPISAKEDVYRYLNSMTRDAQYNFENLNDLSSGWSDHATLSNLAYAASGHTGFEPSLTAGVNTQYYRGDKTWATLSTAVVTAALTSLIPLFVVFAGEVVTANGEVVYHV